jgi:uncharacterized protein (TIGR03067 family)
MSGVEPNAKGTWRQVAAVIDGKNIPVASVGLYGSGTLLRASDDGYVIMVNGKVYQRGTSKADYTKTPHQADVSVTDGPRAGETAPQIFMIEGDVLVACNAPPGAARPTEFRSAPGSGHTLSVWLRTPEAAVAPLSRSSRFWLIALFLLLASVLGGASDSLKESLGPWVGNLVGGLAGAFFMTVVFLLLKWGWQSALALGITVGVAGSIFEGLRPAVAPALGPLGAVLVGASTAFVAALIVGLVMTRLFKMRQ